MENQAGDTVGFGQFRTGPDKSFGVFVCTNDGEVTLETIEPVSSEGAIEFLGAMVYTSDDRYIGAADGFPPEGMGDANLVDLEEAVVASDCTDQVGDDRVQLIVGAERTGSGGGMIEGLLVQTSAGDVEIPLTILLCGDELEFCEVLNQGTAP